MHIEEETPLQRLAHQLRSDDLALRLERAALLDLSELEMEAIAKDGDFRVMSVLAANPSVIIDILNDLADPSQEQAVRRAVASNPSCTPSLLARLAADSYIRARVAVALHPSTHPNTLLYIVENDTSYEVRAALASRTDASLEIFTRLLSDDRIEVLLALAANRSTPPPFLDKLSLRVDSPLDLRLAIASNSSAASKTLRRLARGGPSVVALAVANNPGAKDALLEDLVSHYASEPQLIRQVIDRDNLSDSFFYWLVTKGPLAARLMLAQRAFMDYRFFESLTRDEEPQVLLLLAANSFIPPDLLYPLASESQPAFIRQAVAGNKNCPEKLLHLLAVDLEASVRQRVAEHPHCAPGILEALAKDQTEAVRTAVAGSHHTPLAVLFSLLKDEHEVLHALARNSSATLELLEELLVGESGEEEDLLIAIAAHHNASPELIRTVYQRCEEEGVKMSCAQNLNTPPEVMLKIAKTAPLPVRRALLENPSLSLNILVKIARRERYRSRELAELAAAELERRHRRGESSGLSEKTLKEMRSF